MRGFGRFLGGVCLALLPAHAMAQAVGSVDNFDCVNDTGETAYGFEMDIEDIDPSGLVREFPSNFSGQEYVQRYGVPTVTAYDNTGTGGHKGVLVTWAAAWDGTQWVAKYGDYSYNGQVSGNGTPYIAKPFKTQGDSCWLLGLGTGYANSGCDHFGVSFAAGVTPGAIHYHWKVPDAANPGQLVNAAWAGNSAPIPPAPVQAYVAPVAVGQPAIVHAVAEAPEQEVPEAQWSDAIWVQTITYTASAAIDLDQLQAVLLPKRSTKTIKVRKSWALLQRAPAGEPGEKQEVDDDPVEAGKAAVIKRYAYYAYAGNYDPETHEALCAVVPKSNGDCIKPFVYKYADPLTGVVRSINEKGKYMGAHNAEYVLP